MGLIEQTFFDLSNSKKKYFMVGALAIYAIAVISSLLVAYIIGILVALFGITINDNYSRYIRLIATGLWLLYSLPIVKSKNLFSDGTCLIDVLVGVVMSYFFGVGIGYLPSIYLAKK